MASKFIESVLAKPLADAIDLPPKDALRRAQARKEAAYENPRDSDGMANERAAVIVALKSQGYSTAEIAKQTRLTPQEIKTALRLARLSGALTDTLLDLPNRALPQAIENLVAALENPKHEHHWPATIETLHGLGAFKQYKNNTSDGAGGVSPLQVNFVMKDGGDVPTIIVNGPRGEIGGVAREDEEIV